jgi:Domain of unknown function (DUF1995)
MKQNFESVYYLKAMPGGWLFRKYPEDWQVMVNHLNLNLSAES